MHPRHGAIRYNGQNLAGLGAHTIAAMGIVQVPEGRRIFGRLTVSENLDMGAFTRTGRRAIAEDKDRMMELFPRLRERLKQVAGTLSGGEQQMVATARAMMARPRTVLMDEPSMGLAPMMVEQVFRNHPHDQCAGRDGAAGRAECAAGAHHRRLRLRARERQGGAVRAGSRTARR